MVNRSLCRSYVVRWHALFCFALIITEFQFKALDELKTVGAVFHSIAFTSDGTASRYIERLLVRNMVNGEYM